MAFVTIPSTDYDPDSPMTTGLMGNVVGNLNDLDARIVDDIVDLDDVLTSMTPADGQVLTFDTINKWQAETPSSALIIEPNVGAYPTLINIYNVVAESVWESIGPTGSGADNIWTAMDVMPSGASFVILKIGLNDSQDPLYLRRTGDTTGTNKATKRLKSQGALAIVPVDTSNRFDLNWDDSAQATTVFEIYLSGYQ